MAIEHAEELHECDGGLCLAGFVTRERIHASAEDPAGFALIQGQLLADGRDEGRVDRTSIHLLHEVAHLAHDPVGLVRGSEGFTAGGAVIAHHPRDDRSLAFIGEGLVARIVDKLGCATYRAFHVTPL